MLNKFLNYEYKLISINNILLNDDIRISHNCFYSDLFLSILKYGLLSPIKVLKTNDKYIVISGFKRIDVIRKLCFYNQFVPIKCLVLNDISLYECLILNILENLNRGLNYVEIANMFLKLSKFVDSKTIINNFMPILNLNKSEIIYEKFLSILKLNFNVKTAIVENKLPFDCIYYLSKFSYDEQDLFLEIAYYTKMGMNLLNEVSKLIYEVAIQYSKTPYEIIKMIWIDENLKVKYDDTNKRTEVLRNLLHKLKWPTYESTLLKFKELSKEFTNHQISLNPFPYFEKDEINIKFTIKSKKDLENKLKILNNLKNSKLIEEFLKDK